MHNPTPTNPAAWIRWALDQFNLFNAAPRLRTHSAGGDELDPYDVVRVWVPELLRWLQTGAGDGRKRAAAALILSAWNSEIAVADAPRLEVAYAGMDDTNRKGVRKVLECLRNF